MGSANSVIYLAGGMEHAEDGISWRQQATKMLKPEGIYTWNPYKEEKKLFDIDIQEFIKTHDRVKDYDKFNKVMNRIVTADLDVIFNNAEAVLVKYDKSVLRGAGTHAEISFATYMNTPVHAWLDSLDLAEVPLWAIGCFSTVAFSLEDALENVKEGHLKFTRIYNSLKKGA